MDLKGKIVTIHPLAEQGAVIPPGYDIQQSVKAYHDQLAKSLTKAGLNVRSTIAGVPGEGFAVTGRIVRIDPGSKRHRFFLGFLSVFTGGGAIFEVEGQVGDASAPYAQLHAVGRWAYGSFWSSNKRGVKIAAMMAANDLAKKAVNALKAR